MAGRESGQSSAEPSDRQQHPSPVTGARGRRARPWEERIDSTCEVITSFYSLMSNTDCNPYWVKLPRVLLSTRIEKSYIYESCLSVLGHSFEPCPIGGTAARFGLLGALEFVNIYVSADLSGAPFLVTFFVLPGAVGPGGVDWILGKNDIDAAYNGNWKPDWSIQDYILGRMPAPKLDDESFSPITQWAPGDVESSVLDMKELGSGDLTYFEPYLIGDMTSSGPYTTDAFTTPRQLSGPQDTSSIAGTQAHGSKSVYPRVATSIGSYTAGETHNTDSGYASIPKQELKGAFAGANWCDSVPYSAAREEDTHTVYSGEGSLADQEVDLYKSEFVDDLVEMMRKLELEPKGLDKDKMFEALPRLLKTFALRLGQRASSKEERDVMYFVHKHRQNISERFKQAMGGESEEDPIQDRKPVDPELKNDRLKEWLGDSTDREMMEEMEPWSSDVGDDGPELPGWHDYRRVVFDSAAYKCLSSDLARECLLTPCGEDAAMKIIRARILTALPAQQHVSRGKASRTFTMNLYAKWDPVSFIREQFENQDAKLDILGRVITLTGSMGDAQALTCLEYLKQTWPSVGPSVLALIIKGLDTGEPEMETLPDRTELKASLSPPGQCQLSVTGTPDCIAEIAEVFAWITAALRASSSKSVIELCTPYLGFVVGNLFNGPEEYNCEVGFQLKPDVQWKSQRGRCWHGLFRNPVVVTGFPIPRRQSADDTGLEIPLSMAAGLTNALRLHDFHGRFFLKGFSAMLVAMAVVGDLVLWHLYYNASGERISYVDTPNETWSDETCSDSIGINLLRSGRHVIGWCSEALYMFGDPSANYEIGASKLPTPGQDLCFEKLTVNAGQIVTIGLQFSIGKKDTPVHITKNGYSKKLQSIEKRYFVMWDEDDKRGWLTRGTSALLHLLRASLKHSASDTDDFVFDSSSFVEAEHRFQTTSAAAVLRNKTNRELDLCEVTRKKSTIERRLPDGTVETTTEIHRTYETVQDRVEELFDVLDKLISHQEDAKASQTGINMKLWTRSDLLGWDFRDVATQCDPFQPRVAKSPATWVEFAKSINAVTLFGRGFGELIRPAETPSPTKAHIAWKRMPTGDGLLGTCLVDLKAIIDTRGGSRTGESLTLSRGIIWRNPSKDNIFTPDDSTTGTWNPIQELVSEAGLKGHSFLRRSAQSNPLDIDSCEHGAVIFGRSKSRKPSRSGPEDSIVDALIVADQPPIMEPGTPPESASTDPDSVPSFDHQTSQTGSSERSRIFLFGGSESTSKSHLSSVGTPTTELEFHVDPNLGFPSVQGEPLNVSTAASSKYAAPSKDERDDDDDEGDEHTSGITRGLRNMKLDLTSTGFVRALRAPRRPQIKKPKVPSVWSG